jgi:hypothetical protein
MRSIRENTHSEINYFGLNLLPFCEWLKMFASPTCIGNYSVEELPLMSFSHQLFPIKFIITIIIIILQKGRCNVESCLSVCIYILLKNKENKKQQLRLWCVKDYSNAERWRHTFNMGKVCNTDTYFALVFEFCGLFMPTDVIHAPHHITLLYWLCFSAYCCSWAWSKQYLN